MLTSTTPTPTAGGQRLPTSLIVNTIDLIARVGNIGWVDPDVEWYQARVNNTYTGYIPRTTTNGTQILGLRCTNPTGLGAPLPDTGMPNVPALTVFSPPSARLFDSNQSPAVMGACGIHIGASNPCVPNANGSTIDLVPRNHEFCIDTRNANLLVQCDPSFSSPIDTNLIPVPPRVPMFAPAGGCATFDNNPAQVIIRLFRPSGPGGQTECNTPVQNGDLLIVLTHLTNSPIIATPNRQPINAGDLVGYLCLHTGNEAFNVCGVFQPTIPTHLAFQLQTFNGQFQQVPADILPYTSRMGCLYDNWTYNQGNPQIQLSPIRGCP